jgi:heat shock protein HslJ
MTNFSPLMVILIFIGLARLIAYSNDSVAAHNSIHEKLGTLSTQTRDSLPNNMPITNVMSKTEKQLNISALGSTTVNGGSAQEEQIGAISEWQGIRVFTQNTPEGIDGKAITLKLQHGKATGFSGCNTFNSNYTLKGESLKFDSFMSTRRACVDDNLMALERTFLKLIATVDGYKLSNGNLLLTAKSTPVIEMKVM